MLALIVLTLGACSSDDTMLSAEDSEPCLTLRLSLGREIGMLRGSSNPTGGEIGDGLEAGVHHENDINNLCVFKFNAGTDGINGPYDTPAQKLAYVDGIDFAPEVDQFSPEVITHDVPLKNVQYEYTNNDHFIVVVNSGNILGENTTLGAIRDHLMQKPWTASANGVKADFTDFTMANADDSYYTPGNNTAANPRTVHVNLERTAARIDFAIDGSVVKGDRREYEVHGTSGSKVLLSHVRPFNVMQEPTYMIKRLAADDTQVPSYVGDEENPAVQYVVEPHTWLKTDDGKTEAILNQWYDKSRLPKTEEAYATWFNNDYKVHVGSGHAFTDGVTYDNLFHNTFYVVDYANENTATIDDTDGKVTTGMKLKATFVPGTVYTYDGNELTAVLYTAGTTFYRYQPVTDSDNYNDESNLYFLTYEDADAYKANHPEEMAKITEYTNGLCYYTAWLRHDRQYDANNETIGKNMMEFGIVRNNIYRLKVEFSGPGSNTPVTDEDPEAIRSYIYVKKWNYIEHPEIEI